MPFLNGLKAFGFKFNSSLTLIAFEIASNQTFINYSI